MSMNQKRLSLLALVIVGLLLLLLNPFGSTAIAGKEQAVPSGKQEPLPATATLGTIERKVLPVVPRFFDKLTLEPLPEELEIIWVGAVASESMPVASGLPPSLLAAGKGAWVLRKGDQEMGTYPLKMTFSAEMDGYLIPYMGIVEADLRGMRDEDFENLACQASPLQGDIYEFARGNQESNILDSVYEQGTPAYTLRRYLRFDGPEEWQPVTKVVEGQRHLFRWVGPGQGTLAFKLESKTYGEKVQIAQPIAGEIQRVSFILHRGPRLRGTLRNQDGDPMPHQTLRALVEIGPDGDWGDTPGSFAVAVGGSPGNWHRCAQGSLTTDEKGEFSIEMPVGTRYAMEYGGKDSYGFTESLPFPTPPDGDVILDVTTIDFDNWYPVQVLDSQGKAMAGVFVQPLIGNDYPWFRQFVAVPTDEEGRAFLPGILPGTERVVIRVQPYRDWSKAKFLTSQKFDPLPSPPLQLVVPDSAD